MRIKLLFVLTFFIGCAMSACSANLIDQIECHDKVVEHGRKVFDLARQVDEFFGAENVDHFISDYESKINVPEWNSVVYFGGRYMFSLSIPIDIDYKNCNFIKSTGLAFIQINEVTKVEINEFGGVGARMEGQWRLTESEWKGLLESNGDWSVVNVPILKDAPPIENFDKYVTQSRKQRYR